MEIWLSWMFPLAGALIFIGILRGVFSKRLKPGWKTSVVQVTGLLFSIPFALLTFFSLLAIGCESNGPLLGSPDHLHVARVQTLDGGALGGSASVAVRHSWYPNWRYAYKGDGQKQRDGSFDPEVKWVDNSHLLILYPGRGVCLDNVGDVFVTCEQRK